MKVQSKKENSRKKAMSWWRILSSAYKTQICDLNQDLIGGCRRWETLTGREIEMLYEEEKDNFETIKTIPENKNRATQSSPFGIGS